MRDTCAVLQEPPTSASQKARVFEKLVAAYEGRIYNIALRLLGDPEMALDVTQEAFVKALQGLGDFRRQSSFYTWLCRITINLCYSERRRQKRRRLSSLYDVEHVDAGERGGEPAFSSDADRPQIETENKERSDRVRRAVDALEPDLRFVVVLRDMEGFSYEEVAQALRIPVGTVRSRLHRAREQLRMLLRSWLDDDL